MRTESSLRPILMAGMGVSCFSFLDASTKFVAGAYPLMQVVGMRYGVGAFFAVLVYLCFGDGWPSWEAIRRNLLRSVITLGTAACFFTALARLPLVEAITLTFLAPLLMALLGRLILKEPIGFGTLVGIGVGFAGVVVIARGQNTSSTRDFDLVGLLAALGCALFYALSMVLMRKQTSRDSLMTIVFLSNCWCFLIILPLGLLQWQPVAPMHWLAIVPAGFFGTCGNLCMAWAYARAPAGRLAILEYLAFIWALTFGYFIFAETPTNWTLAGAVLIMAACLFATFTKNRPA